MGVGMFGLLKKFGKDRRGAFAMQFALMAIPLCVCTGLAIDGGRAFLARFELASALDAAALAVGSTIDESADLDEIARKYVDINFKTEHDEPIELSLDTDDDRAILTGSVRINTYFMPIIGQNYVEVSAESEVRRGGNNVEVALALDITQSMNSPSSKIAALRVAATDLIDQVVGTSQSPYFSRAAIVPWGTNIHLGTYATAIRGPVTGTTNITAAAWRATGTSTRTLASGTGWRTNTGKTISTPGVTWKKGSSFTISKVTKSGTPSRVQITVSGTPTALVNGDYVYLLVPSSSPANSYTAPLHGIKFMLADKSGSSPWTFNLKDTAGTYITPPAGSVNATTGTVQECFTATCELQVKATGHGFANGDLINIQGVTEAAGTGATTPGTTSLNNTATTTYTISGVTTDTFNLSGTNGPAYKNWSSGGKASECYVSDCRYQVTTTAAHGFSTGAYVFINGATVGSTGTNSPNNAANTSWTIAGATGSVFYLPGTGNSYKDWTSGGSVYACANATCNVQVTSASHGLSNNDWIEIAGVGGLTGINSSTVAAWQVTGVSGSNFLLNDSTPALTNMSSAYTSGGTSQCLEEGCQKLRFLSAAGTYQIKSISNCGTERVGTYAHTDEPPSTAYIGRDYPGSGSLVGCVTGTPNVGGVGGSGNYLTPLTADKNALNKAITDMTVAGSTSGQIGTEWAWYMLSPNWASVWPGAATPALTDTTFDPMPYDTDELVKVAILMTDGAFNTAHCKGVTTETYAYSSVSNSDRIDSSECTAADTPFELAQATCTAMKHENIVIYTVGFEVGSEPGAAEFLTECASSPAYVYLAADGTALREAFQKIATSISKLRLAR
jgi:Flp pilus assembly protein TadG